MPQALVWLPAAGSQTGPGQMLSAQHERFPGENSVRVLDKLDEWSLELVIPERSMNRSAGSLCVKCGEVVETVENVNTSNVNTSRPKMADL